MPKQVSSKLVMIRKTDEFSSVFSFRKRYSSKHLIVYYTPTEQAIARVGFVVSKKVAKLAVDRNYMRRVLREFFRLHQHEICPVDIVIRVHEKFSNVNFVIIKQQVEESIIKINQRINIGTQQSSLCKWTA